MDERQRQNSLEKYHILGTLPEEAFDEITRLAAEICNVPIAMISFVDNELMWFKSYLGTEINQIDRRYSFCNFTIQDTKPLVVPDAILDERFKELPVVVGGPKVRFYAGAPLIAPDGVIIGSLCVLATEPQNLSASQVKSLERLAKLVMQFLASRLSDIGEKQAAQSNLETQKDFLNAVLDNLSDGVIACNAHGEMRVVNGASRRFADPCHPAPVPKEEWAERFQIFHGDGERMMRADEVPLYRALQGEVIRNTEIILVTTAGERRRLITNGQALVDKEGNKLGALLTMRDVTEERNAVSRAQAANLTLRTLVDLAPVGITMLDEDNRITTWNKTSEEITGWKEAEVLGRSIYEAFVGNEANSARVQECLSGPRKSFSSEMEYLTKSGDKVDVQISVVPIYDGEGRPSGSMAISMNISDIRERERKLLEANRVLQEASEAKSNFLANMSHEIRTPLNGVIAMNELVLLTALTEKQQNMIRTVQSSAQGLLGILTDILDYSKVEAGKLEIEKVDFDLKETIQQVLSSIEPIAKSKDLTLTASWPDHIPEKLSGDPGRLRQVVLNLVSNAVKFTEKGEVSTTLSLSPQADGKTLLRFEVRDSGIGISEDQLAKLFRAFSQADASTTRRFGGTGLGLSISQSLIKLMNGEIGAESVQGRGSRFWFTLPLEIAGADKKSTPSQVPTAMTLPQFKGVHVLVAEDNPVNQHIAKSMLAKFGITCDVVENGELALAALETGEYHAVFMDCQMPVMDGYEATRELRARRLSPYQNIPVIALTAHAMAGDRERCLEAGMNEYLSKPLLIRSLCKTLEEVLGRRPQQAS